VVPQRAIKELPCHLSLGLLPGGCVCDPVRWRVGGQLEGVEDLLYNLKVPAGTMHKEFENQ
jgi:hypothetical protein